VAQRTEKITPEAADALNEHKHFLSHNGLVTLSDEAKASLWAHPNIVLRIKFRR